MHHPETPLLLRSPTQRSSTARPAYSYATPQLSLNVITSTDSTDSVTQRFLYSPFTKSFYRASSNDEEEGIYSCLDNMGGVVSARKAQYFEPKYESKPSARVRGAGSAPDGPARGHRHEARGDPQGRTHEAPQPLHRDRPGAARFVRTERSPLPQGVTACYNSSGILLDVAPKKHRRQQNNQAPRLPTCYPTYKI